MHLTNLPQLFLSSPSLMEFSAYIAEGSLATSPPMLGTLNWVFSTTSSFQNTGKNPKLMRNSSHCLAASCSRWQFSGFGVYHYLAPTLTVQLCGSQFLGTGMFTHTGNNQKQATKKMQVDTNPKVGFELSSLEASNCIKAIIYWYWFCSSWFGNGNQITMFYCFSSQPPLWYLSTLWKWIISH